MILILQSVFFIFVCHLIISIRDRTFFDYFWYYKVTNDTFFDYIIKIFWNYKPVYIAAVFEELIFRGLLIYINNNFAYYIINIVFALQHYESTKSLKQNVILIIYTFILGLIFSQVLKVYGLIYSILLHLLNNLLTTMGCFVQDYGKQNERIVYNYLNNVMSK